MPHVPRKKSESGFHHVVTKGDGSQVVFESDKDRKRYLGDLADSLNDHRVKLHAYCLMSNHVHLLIQDKDGNISSFMKQLNERYAMYFREVTGRVGHVFQRPFWSEPVDTDERFLCTVRYIHANPEVAHMCSTSEYPWSSYKAHLAESPIVEVSLTRDLLGSVSQFESFSASGGRHATPFSGSKLRGHLSYDELLGVACHAIGKQTLNSLKAMVPRDREAPIKALRSAGLSEREIARLTGLGRASVRAAFNR